MTFEEEDSLREKIIHSLLSEGWHRIDASEEADEKINRIRLSQMHKINAKHTREWNLK